MRCCNVVRHRMYTTQCLMLCVHSHPQTAMGAGHFVSGDRAIRDMAEKMAFLLTAFQLCPAARSNAHSGLAANDTKHLTPRPTPVGTCTATVERRSPPLTPVDDSAPRLPAPAESARLRSAACAEHSMHQRTSVWNLAEFEPVPMHCDGTA